MGQHVPNGSLTSCHTCLDAKDTARYLAVQDVAVATLMYPRVASNSIMCGTSYLALRSQQSGSGGTGNSALIVAMLLQVSWKVQLLVSSIEEAGRYAALTAAPREWGVAGGPEGAQLPSRQYARLSLTVVAAAVASSSLMEALYQSAYARHVAASRAAKQQAAVSKQQQCGT
jgi:hypothetical protein